MQLGMMLRNLDAVDKNIDSAFDGKHPGMNDEAILGHVVAVIGASQEAYSEVCAYLNHAYEDQSGADESRTINQLAGVVVTAILAMNHLSASQAQVGNALVTKVREVTARTSGNRKGRPRIFDGSAIWQWDDQEQYDEWLDRMMRGIPDCWDADEAAESILERYMRRLEATRDMHTEQCDKENPFGH